MEEVYQKYNEYEVMRVASYNAYQEVAFLKESKATQEERILKLRAIAGERASRDIDRCPEGAGCRL